MSGYGKGDNAPPDLGPLTHISRATAAASGIAQGVTRLLMSHWLQGITCRHNEKTDQALCYCGWRGPECANVGDAVKSWAEHVAEHVTETAADDRTSEVNMSDSTDVPMCDHCGKYRVFKKGELCGVCILSDDTRNLGQDTSQGQD